MCINNYRKDKLWELYLTVNIAAIHKNIKSEYVQCKFKKKKIKFKKVSFMRAEKNDEE